MVADRRCFVDVRQADAHRGTVRQQAAIGHAHRQRIRVQALKIERTINRDLARAGINREGAAFIPRRDGVAQNVARIRVTGSHTADNRTHGGVFIYREHLVVHRRRFVDIHQADTDRRRVRQRSAIGHAHRQHVVGQRLKIERALHRDFAGAAIDGKGATFIARRNGVAQRIAGIRIARTDTAHNRAYGHIFIDREPLAADRRCFVDVRQADAHRRRIRQQAVIGHAHRQCLARRVGLNLASSAPSRVLSR